MNIEKRYALSIPLFAFIYAFFRLLVRIHYYGKLCTIGNSSVLTLASTF